jgi:hypothetical protein
MTAVGLVDATRNTILIAAEDYPETVVLDGVNVTLVGEDGANIKPELGAGEIAVSVGGTSVVSFDNVDIDLEVGGSASSVALKCDTATNTATVSYSNGTIAGSAGLGVSSSRCDLTVTGSTILGNAGGISCANSDYRIENNFIAKNSGDSVGGIAISGDGATPTKVVNFNTFAENTRTDPGYAIGCSASDLVASNNIFLHVDNGTNTAFVSGSACSTTHSLFDTDVVLPVATGNISGNAVFVNSAGGNYHLMTGSPGINAADPDATLATDIDGEARPQGGRHDMGADEAE